ncbi:13908_t:CDS:2 [Ambispora leptoticha]|uniref:13908_t:CDS:1 n=1 Tax=Ambispora leptoticha TaxID=144679 RepID=A0A9N9AGG2_9GLOM|nr:13908_t:CDS:2 [Ambispora leptoticha]
MVNKFLSTGFSQLETKKCTGAINRFSVAFNIAFLLSDEIREEYRRRNGGSDNLVRANDVFFAVHAFGVSAFTLYQSFIYKRDKYQRLSSTARAFIILTLFGIFLLSVRVLDGKEWIDLLYFLGYIKLCISLIKYLPQVRLNYMRKSTIGWSIHNILLDFTGGMLSLFQLIFDAYLENNWSGISGDPIKFGLGLLSILFDLIFMIQHYILYRHPSKSSIDDEIVVDTTLSASNNSHSNEENERQPLLKKKEITNQDDLVTRYV